MSFLKWMTGFKPEEEARKGIVAGSKYDKAYRTFQAYMTWNPIRDHGAFEELACHGNFSSWYLDSAFDWSETGIEDIIIEYMDEVTGWEEEGYFDDEDEWIQDGEFPEMPTILKALVDYLEERGITGHESPHDYQEVRDLEDALRTVGVIN